MNTPSRMKVFRVAAGLSQEELADKSARTKCGLVELNVGISAS